MNVLSTVIYSSMMGITLLALLETARPARQIRNPYLIGVFGLLLLHILGELFIYSGAYRYAPWLAGLNFPLRVLLGPALYFYACSTMTLEKRSKKAVILALIGPFIVLLAMLPFIFGISTEEKLALANPATRDPELWRIAVLTCLFTTSVFMLFTGGFLAASLHLHRYHRQQLMERFSDIEQRSFDWLRTVLYLWGVAWCLYAIEFVLGAFRIVWFGTGIVLPLVEAGVLIAFIHKAINQPELDESEKVVPAVAQSRMAAISADKMGVIADKLTHAMEHDRRFLQEDLSLKRLSEYVAESENHISETLSQHLNTNFFTFVNGFRIEEAKKQLADNNKLVSTIAYDVGFNSKSTFNAAFKKIVGTTPSVYRQHANAATC